MRVVLELSVKHFMRDMYAVMKRLFCFVLFCSLLWDEMRG